MMKKLALILVLTLGFAFSANAGCFEDAWDHGTKYGGGNSDREYFLMNQYYENNCL